MSGNTITMAEAITQTTQALAKRFKNQFVDTHDLKSLDPYYEFNFDLAVSIKTVDEAIEIELTDHGKPVMSHTITPFDDE